MTITAAMWKRKMMPIHILLSRLQYFKANNNYHFQFMIMNFIFAANRNWDTDCWRYSNKRARWSVFQFSQGECYTINED